MQPEKQLNLTDAGTIPRDLVASTEIGMAHFAGTGPRGKRCKDCSQWQMIAKRRICWKFATLTGDRKKSISGGAAACSHFQKK